MSRKNLFNILIALGLLFVATVYFTKDNFNHSGPKGEISEVPDDLPKIEEKPKINEIKKYSTYEEALKIAEKENKKILIVFGTKSCGWCLKLKNETLSETKVKEAMNTLNVIDLYIDASQRPDLARKYKVRGVPAYFVIDPEEGKILRSGSGFKEADDFINWIESKWGKNQKFLTWLFRR